MRSSVILIPSYEPDELLINTVHELKEAGFPILIVNDGSGPEFEPIFDAVKKDVQYLSYETNHGKGYAMKHGYAHIRELFPDAKFVITADGDGQHSTKDIIAVHEEMEKYNELVFGVRNFGKDVPARSKAGNNFSKATRSLLTKTYIQDDQCGLRGFPVRYIPELLKIKGNRYEYEMNEIALFQLKQYPMITIPIQTIYLDSNSRSHFRPFRDTMKIQGIILFNSIISLLTLALYITGLILLWRTGALHFDIEPSNVLHIDTNTFLTICLASTGSFIFYFALMSIFYPTKRPIRRLWKELLFAAIRTYVLCLMSYLLIDLCHIWVEVVFPVFAIAACALNIFFAWVFRRLFRSF